MEELDEEEQKRSAFGYIIALFLILLVVAWGFSRLNVKLDEHPGQVPGLDNIRNFIPANDSFNAHSEVGAASRPESVKLLSNFIAVNACPGGSRVCYAKALYYFVRDNLRYISDPVGAEYVQEPLATLKSGGGDCDDGAVLLASMLSSIGIRAEFVFVPGHVLVKAFLPEALSRYKTSGDWVYLDWTCRACEFGAVP
jgi:hypothetical protein